MINLETKLDSAERHLIILEHKLVNVSNLNEPNKITVTGNDASKNCNESKVIDTNQSRENELIKDKNGLKAKDHPIFGRYFRMLKMVRLKLLICSISEFK
jgi:hypothetical protein